MAFTDRQRMDIVMLRGLNRTYDEIAAHLNSTYDDVDTSGKAVGRVVREMEDESERTSPHAVFDKVVIKGYVEELL